jgi:ribosomal protein S27E
MEYDILKLQETASNYVLERVRCPICDHDKNVTFNHYDLMYYCGDCGESWEGEPFEDNEI